MSRQLTTRKNDGRGLPARGQYHPLDMFRQEVGSLFDRFFGWPTSFEEDFSHTRGWGLDVDEDDKVIVVRADVPGFEEKELNVQLEGDVLTIKAEKEQQGDDRREYRSFFRQVTLPAGVDAEKVQANYRNGVLELHIPRPEGSQIRRIPVKCQTLEDKSGGEGDNCPPAGERATSKKTK